MLELFLLALIGALVWYIADSLRAREHAYASGRQACERNNLQFLDDTVELVSLRLARNAGGRLSLRRVYAFEFSDPLLAGGDNRARGRATLLGAEVESLVLDPFRMP